MTTKQPARLRAADAAAERSRRLIRDTEAQRAVRANERAREQRRAEELARKRAAWDRRRAKRAETRRRLLADCVEAASRRVETLRAALSTREAPTAEAAGLVQTALDALRAAAASLRGRQ